ncbi:hypothetical protein LPJ66_004678 [Kickxella alabastrina]|uniref:Uncharacterized protein n=1 Tax=Kickxella alabastrina TaxID=61397 RepID=A0ACC1IKL0_9FUNG|nr:hypothetical protein LPJ66_004678 [Kickxella alabastrina]
MNREVWAEAATTVLATLESALLGVGAGPVDMGASAGSSRSTTNSRKHNRRTTSDTMSDIETPGSPVKRRRESVDGTYTEGESTKPTVKSRKISSALSRQFARSLSVSNGSAFETPGGYTNIVAVDDEIAIETSQVSPHALSAVSSSSSLSSNSQWPPEGSNCIGRSDTTTGDVLVDRVYVHPSASRSLKAREKVGECPDDSRVKWAHVPSRCSMDMDSSDSASVPIGAGHVLCGGIGNFHHGVGDKEVFVELLVPAQQEYAFVGESVNVAVQRWAVEQSHIVNEPPAILTEILERNILRLKELISAVMDQIAGDCKRGPVLGEHMREFYRAGCEIASIGEWLYQRHFQLLPALFPALSQALPQLQGLIRVARIVEDMYRLLQWTPEFSSSLGEMSAEYEELVHAKRALYGEVISQDGLQWKAMGLPVDSMLLLRVKQWVESVSVLCLTHIARICERRAKSVSAYDKEELSMDSLMMCSNQVLHSAALCANMCGGGFPNLAPLALYIVAECTTWACNKIRSSPATAPPDTCRYRGKQLATRAMRLIQAGEGILKQLSYVKALLLTPDRSLFGVCLPPDHGGSTSLTALQSLASSLVEVSWYLAEALAAFRADGQMSNPSGVLQLYAEFVAKFAKRVVDFGGTSDCKVDDGEVYESLRRIQSYVHMLIPA